MLNLCYLELISIVHYFIVQKSLINSSNLLGPSGFNWSGLNCMTPSGQSLQGLTDLVNYWLSSLLDTKKSGTLVVGILLMKALIPSDPDWMFEQLSSEWDCHHSIINGWTNRMANSLALTKALKYLYFFWTSKLSLIQCTPVMVHTPSLWELLSFSFELWNNLAMFLFWINFLDLFSISLMHSKSCHQGRRYLVPDAMCQNALGH